MSDPSVDAVKDRRLPALHAVFQSLFNAGGEVGEWTEERWERLMAIVDEAGRLVYGYPQHFDSASSIFGAIDTLTSDLEITKQQVLDANGELRKSIDELRAAKAGHETTAPVDVAEPAHIVSAFRQPEPSTLAPASEASHVTEPALIVEPIVKSDADYAFSIPEIPTCPDCGKTFKSAGGLAGHWHQIHGAGQKPRYDREAMFAAIRAHDRLSDGAKALGLDPATLSARLDTTQAKGKLPADILAKRPIVGKRAAAAVSDAAPPVQATTVVELNQDDWPKPLPERATAAGTDDFAERRKQQAKAAADRAWAARHPGEAAG